MVFDEPLSQAPDLPRVLSLFKAWAVAKGSLSLEFKLRDDVLFHNGDKLTAEDIRFT